MKIYNTFNNEKSLFAFQNLVSKLRSTRENQHEPNKSLKMASLDAICRYSITRM